MTRFSKCFRFATKLETELHSSKSIIGIKGYFLNFVKFMLTAVLSRNQIK